MSLISRKIAAFAKKVANLSPKPGGTMPVTELQAQFDAAPEELRAAFNGAIDDIVADYATKAELSGIQLGQITDGSLTEPKLETTVAKKLNDGNNAINALSWVSRQAIINGNFSINQRVVSGTVTLAAGQYGHDRWKAGANGCTYTFATSNNVTTITITAGSLVQVIEGNNLFSGPYILSWVGTSQGKIGAGVYGSSGVTATVAGGTNLSIEFNAGTLSKVQFSAGSVVLPFQPRSFAEEFTLCQRYYWKTFSYNVAPAQNAGLSGSIMYRVHMSAANNIDGVYVRFPAQMRIAPTITFYNPLAANNKWRNFSGSVDSGVPAAQASGDSACFVENTQVAGDAVGNILVINMSADAEL